MPASDILASPGPASAAEAGHRHITLHDVAARAGISAMTAWRAVNTPDKVPPRTLERVREAVAHTGYVPNLVAGGLRSKKTRMVAALVPTVTGPVFLETIESLTAELEARGFQLMLGQSGYEKSREDALISAIVGRRPDGLVLTGILHSPQARRMLQAARIPVVETWDLSDDPIDMLVGFSHEGVGAAVCAFLAERAMAPGRTRLAVLGGSDERSARRMEAFQAEAVRRGLGRVAKASIPAPVQLGDARRAFAELVQAHPDIGGIFCSSDVAGLGVLTEARVRGIEVPGELGVVGFGDLSFARDVEPALTTVRIDGTRIGKIAAGFMVDGPAGRSQAERVVDVGFTLVERAST